MNLKLTKHQLKLFEFPTESNKSKISKNQRIVDGIKKNATQAVVMSEGKNTSTNIPYIDIRLWVMNSDTEKWVPTPKGLRLTPVQYQAFFHMLKDHENEFLLCGDQNGITKGSILGYLDSKKVVLKNNGELIHEDT